MVGVADPAPHLKFEAELVFSLYTFPSQSIPFLQPTSPKILCMEIESENCYNGIKRKKTLVLDWEDLLPTASGDEDHPPEFVVTSNKKSKVGCSGEDAQENQKEYFELLMKTDHEISEYITRHTKTMSILSESLPDKGQRLKTALRRHEDELQRRKKLPPESQMEEKSDHENSESIARIRKNISILSERFPDKGEKLKAVLRRHEDELQRRKKLHSENQKEDLELQTKSDHEINEFIARHRKNISILSVRLPDKGLRLKAALQRHEDELQRRKKLQSEKGHNECEETLLVSDDIDGGTSPTILCMEIEEENGCNGIKRKKPLALDWEEMLNTASGDDDSPPELVVIPEKKSMDGGSGGDAKEDLELQAKTDHEIREFIARHRKSIPILSERLPDKGEKLKATFRRHEDELERRKKLQSEKGHNGCQETIQLSDYSDDGASCGKKKGDQKSLSSSTFAKLFCQKLEGDKDSRTVNAFEDDLSFINPCQGRKVKPNSRPLGKVSRMGLSYKPASAQEPSRSLRTPLVDSEKQIISNVDKKHSNSTTSSLDRRAGNKPCSFSQTNRHQDQPSRNLRPRHKQTYHLVDEEPQIQTTLQYVEKLDDCMKDIKVYYPSRDDPGSVEVNYADMACLAPEACLSSVIMNFYIQYLQQPTSMSESATYNYHFFNTYFYNKLEKLSYKEDSFLKFRKWWKGVNIFEKAYILLPIHEHVHWSLVIICLPTKEDELGPILLHLDSLGLHDSRSLFDNIRRFLKEEWSYIRKSEAPLDLPIADEIWENLDRRMDDKRVTVPQQRNDYDCGLFVLYYMERFIKEAPERLRKKDLSMFGRQWFHPEEASNLRVRIHNLLAQEFKNAKEKETTSSPKC